MTFDHDFSYSFFIPLFSSLPKKREEEKENEVPKSWSKVMPFCSIYYSWPYLGHNRNIIFWFHFRIYNPIKRIMSFLIFLQSFLTILLIMFPQDKEKYWKSESLNANIWYPIFNYKVTFVNSQHAATYSDVFCTDFKQVLRADFKDFRYENINQTHI